MQTIHQEMARYLVQRFLVQQSYHLLQDVSASIGMQLGQI